MRTTSGGTYREQLDERTTRVGGGKLMGIRTMPTKVGP
jgi:hypothetical protein